MNFLQSKRVVRAILLVLLVGMAGMGKVFGQMFGQNLTLNGNIGDASNYTIPFYGQFSTDQPVYSQFIIPASELTGFMYEGISSLRFYFDPFSVYEMPYWYPGSDDFRIYFAEVENEIFDYWQYELYSGEMTLVFDSYELGDYYSIDNNRMEFYLHYDDETYSYYQYNGGNLLVYVQPIQISNPYYSIYWQGTTSNGTDYGYASLCQEYDYVYGVDFRPRVTFNGVDNYQTATSNYVPFYGQFDSNQPVYSQFIIPASDLSPMQYGEIQSLSFYISKDALGYDDPVIDDDISVDVVPWNSWDQFQIYIAEVDNETFFRNENGEYALYDEDQMTLAFDGADYYNHYGSHGDDINVYDDGDYYRIQFRLHFDYEYVYNEDIGMEIYHCYPYYNGNLLVYVKPVQISNVNNCQWMGVPQYQEGYYEEEGPAAIYYNTGDGEYAYVQGEYFKPMVTIEYTAGEAPSCLRPNNLMASPGVNSVDVYWDDEADGYTLQYKRSSDEEWTTAFENGGDNYYWISGLTSQTEYEVRVKAVCGEGDESEWKTITFTTEAPLAPYSLIPSAYDTPEANTATLNWSFGNYYDMPAYWDIAYTTNMDATPENSTIITIDVNDYYSSYYLTDLTPFATYKAWIRSNYSNGDVSDWSEPCIFTLTNWENVTVNQGGYNSNPYVPFYTNTTSSKSQFIIPASELSDLTSHELTRIGFSPSDSWNLSTVSVNLKIYLKEVNMTEFSSTEYYDWDDMEQVYDGAFSGIAAYYSEGIAYIEFDDSYYYTGGNLLVGVQATECHTSFSIWWRGIETTSNTALASRYNYTPSLYQFLPRTTFYYIPTESSSCITPLYLTCNAVTGTSATLDWTSNGDETAWDIYYSTVATAPDENATPNVIATTQKPYTIEGLVPETTYYAWVRANCGVSKSHWSQSCEFLPTDRIDLTVNDGTSYFSGAPISSSYNMKTQMVIPADDLTSMVNGEIQKLYFYSRFYNNSTTSYSFSNQFTVYVAEIGTDQLGEEFYDWAAMEQLCYQGTLSISDNRMVIDFDVPYKYEGGHLLIGVVGDDNNVDGPYWYGVYGDYDEAGSSMIYTHYNGYSVSSNKPKTTISYIEGEAPVIAKPQGLSANNITQSSADLNWNAMENVSWNLRYKTAETTEWTIVHPTGNSYQMTGLPTNTTYRVQVQAVDGENHSTWSYLTSFTTLCEMFIVDAEHPYTNDFETDPTEECWIIDNWNYYFSYMYTNEINNNASLCMPSIHIDALDSESVYLSFNTSYEMSTDALCSVVVNDAMVWNSHVSEDWVSTFVLLSLDDYRGQDVSVKFQFENNTWNYGAWEVSYVRLGIGLPMEYANIFETEGEWNNPGNWSTGAVPTLEQDVLLRAPATVPSGALASANSITAVYGEGSVTIADGGQVNCNNNFEGTIQKNITGYGNGQGDWYLISIPYNGYGMQPERIDGLLENDYDLYFFNQYQQQAEWRNTKQQDSYWKMEAREGYLYANNTDVTLSYTNMLNAFETGVEIYNYDDTYSKVWNLIGNPLTCNAYINRAFYKMNSTGTALEPAEADAPIRPMEGVFVEITSTEQYQYLIFSKSSSGSKGGGVAKGLRIDLLQEQSTLDNAIISFGEGATLGKFMLNPNGSKIYFPVEGKDYAIVRAGTVGEMPLNFEAGEDGRYTIGVNTEDVGMSSLHLIDNLTGNDVNLLETPEYSFDAKTTDSALRFKLVFVHKK
ncbi:MAG: fibronectin type III domain-containing protein [Bacteroidales bacterium]|nr:fibronectin type III domain-containing protein [Bacteroidales bacterium]